MDQKLQINKRFKYNSIGSFIAFCITILWTKIGVILIDDNSLEFIFNLFISASILSTILHFGGHFSIFQNNILTRTQLRVVLVFFLLAVLSSAFINSSSDFLSFPLAIVFILKLYAESVYLISQKYKRFIFSMTLEPLLRFLIFIDIVKEVWVYGYLILGAFYIFHLINFYNGYDRSKVVINKYYLGLWVSELLGIFLVKGDQYLGFEKLENTESLLLFMLISYLSIPLKFVSLLGRAQGFFHLENKSNNKLFKNLIFTTLLFSGVFSILSFLFWESIFRLLFDFKWAILGSNYKGYFFLIPILSLIQVLDVKVTILYPKLTITSKVLLVLLKILIILLIVDDLDGFLKVYTCLLLLQIIFYFVILKSKELMIILNNRTKNYGNR